MKAIAGFRVLAGECWHLIYRTEPGPVGGVVSTPMIRGPFVVVAAKFGFKGTSGASAALSVVGSPLREVFGVDRLPVRGIPVIERGPAINVAGSAVIGDPRLYPGRTYHWPWYVFEGTEGALALWVWKDLAVATIEVHATVSLWYLARTGAEAVGPSRVVARPAGQYREVAGRLVGRPVG